MITNEMLERQAPVLAVLVESTPMWRMVREKAWERLEAQLAADGDEVAVPAG